MNIVQSIDLTRKGGENKYTWTDRSQRREGIPSREESPCRRAFSPAKTRQLRGDCNRRRHFRWASELWRRARPFRRRCEEFRRTAPFEVDSAARVCDGGSGSGGRVFGGNGSRQFYRCIELGEWVKWTKHAILELGSDWTTRIGQKNPTQIAPCFRGEELVRFRYVGQNIQIVRVKINPKWLNRINWNF